MVEYQFVQVDVFTDHIFGGNALAVFLDGRGLTDEQMQSIAKEMNLSETTFVLPPDDSQDVANVRIFTPGSELPFAGHPTVGTAFVLLGRGVVNEPSFTFQEKIGRIPVRVEGSPASPGIIWMRQPLPSFAGEVNDRADVARRLGLEPADLLDIPIRVGTAGVPFLFVGVRTPETVDRVTLSERDLSGIKGGSEGQGLFVFAPESDSTVYSRMLGSHGLGIVEDPATGGASGPLGALLVQEGIAVRRDVVNILSRQGVAMGRPSDVRIRLTYTGGSLNGVEVGGGVVAVLEGVMRL